MSDKNTRQEILDVALTMFAEYGYHTVSIRDISGAVNIKESSIYYHFKNKQDILDCLLADFENRATGLTAMLKQAIDQSVSADTSSKSSAKFSNAAADNLPIFKWLANYYCDKFLCDPFCNKIMRVLTIEQFHDEALSERYAEWLFDRPLSIQLTAVRLLGGPERFALLFNSYTTRLIYRYLLTGTLTEEKKAKFTEEFKDFLRNMLSKLSED